MYLNSSLLCIAYAGRSAILEGILYPPGPGLADPLIGSLYGLDPKPYWGAYFLPNKVLLYVPGPGTFRVFVGKYLPFIENAGSDFTDYL